MILISSFWRVWNDFLCVSHQKGSLLARGIFFFRVRVELTCSADSRLCHWATGRRGLDNMSAQCLSWFPEASQPRKIFPMASFRVMASWSQTEITRFTLCGPPELLVWFLSYIKYHSSSLNLFWSFASKQLRSICLNNWRSSRLVLKPLKSTEKIHKMTP